MKAIFALLVFVCVLVNPVFALDKKKPKPFNTNEHWASYYASQAVKIKNTVEILKYFPFRKKYFDQVAADIKKHKQDIPKFIIKIKGPRLALIVPGKKNALIDFKDYNKAKLYLNSYPIVMTPTKTYKDVLLEVNKILKMKKVSQINLFFKSAYAQSDEGWYSRLVASLFTSATSPMYVDPDISEKRITSTLVQTYKNDANTAVQFGSSSGIHFQTFTFMCEKGNLNLIEDRVLLRNGYLASGSNSVSRRLLRKPEGYEYRYGQVEIKDQLSCASTINLEGKVIKRIGRNVEFCPAEGVNVFEDSKGFGYFPKAAQTCCQKKGCYEEVQLSLAAIKDKLASRKRPGYERSDAVPGVE